MSNLSSDYLSAYTDGLLAGQKDRDALRARLAKACAYLREVGDDYPGSSCQRWCHERAAECEEGSAEVRDA